MKNPPRVILIQFFGREDVTFQILQEIGHGLNSKHNCMWIMLEVGSHFPLLYLQKI